MKWVNTGGRRGPTWKRGGDVGRAQKQRNKPARRRGGGGGQARSPGADPARSRAFRPGRWPPGCCLLLVFLASCPSSGQARAAELRGCSGPFRPDSRQSQERGVRGSGSGAQGEVRRRAGGRRQEAPRSGRPPRGEGPAPPGAPRAARESRTQVTYNGIVSGAGTAQSLPPRNRRRCRPGHDPLRREGGGGGLPEPWVLPRSRTRSRRFKRFSSFPFVLTWRPSATTATF